MIITLKDGANFYASPEDADRIQNAAQDPNIRQIDIRSLNINIKAIAPWDIKRITSGGEPPLDRSKLISRKHEPTAEEAEARAAHNREVLAKMKEDLIKKGVIRG